MARRRKKKDADVTELIVKGIVGFVILLALAGGGLQGFQERFIGIFVLMGLAAICIAALIGIYVVVRKTSWRQSPVIEIKPSSHAHRAAPRPQVWTESRILESLTKIDWYQFEKFCSELLRAEGFTVAREGGAKPDGGVDHK